MRPPLQQHPGGLPDLGRVDGAGLVQQVGQVGGRPKVVTAGQRPHPVAGADLGGQPFHLPALLGRQPPGQHVALGLQGAELGLRAAQLRTVGRGLLP